MQGVERAAEGEPTLAELEVIMGAGPKDFDNNAWERFGNLVRPDAPSLAGCLDHAFVASFQEGELGLVFGGRASAARAERSYQELLERLAAAGHPGVVSLRIEVGDGDGNTPFKRRKIRATAKRRRLTQELAGHPLVQTIIERFDGTLKRVELKRDDSEEIA